MFEITGDDIAVLGDEDLRALIGRLCEAELRRCGLPAAAATWGGNQTAKDGGLDVRVALPESTRIEGFIPRAATGFQVKKSDMQRAAILKEMRPKNKLRPVISELAKAGGAYIIVSAAGSTADSALTNRRRAMAAAVKGTAKANALVLDFYDRTRVATWVRGHAGLIPWVRARIGRAIKGWRAYGPWSFRPDGEDTPYLIDATTRIRTGGMDQGDGLSAAQGIDRMRTVLRTSGQVVRLVGLSGVGKTRLVEALFDPAVGSEALDRSLAVYTDLADEPDPPPALLASDLIAARTRAILVVDNCPPATHRQLCDISRSAGSTVSIITVEYDIREDQPEGTDVFSLDTSSSELIEKLVGRRAPHLSQVDRRTIANASGGNARVALALASTVGKNETVAGLGDAELFKRLFQQRNDSDTTLLSIAQACALVYSFEGEAFDGDRAELGILGALVGKSPEDVFASVAELRARHLVQSRGPWRAVLPHAVANRLASWGLQRIPRHKILSALANPASLRLFQSFSRRLGYLDSSPEARAIVENWLMPRGFLADVANLDETGQAVFSNVAPVAPDAVLAALEGVIAGGDESTLQRCLPFLRLLRSLAYEPRFLTRALTLLIRLARVSGEENAANDISKVIVSLFPIVLSGTHAPLVQRLAVLRALLDSNNGHEQRLGVRALGVALSTNHFSSPYTFDFGMRSRDYGYHPPTGDAVAAWFSAVLACAAPYTELDGPVGDGVRRVVGREFRGLWTNAGQMDQLERIAQRVNAKRFWRDGWIGAKLTRVYDGKGMPAESTDRLATLENLLRPKDLIDKIRGIVLGDQGGRSIDLGEIDGADDGDYMGAMNRAAATAEALGRDAANDAALLSAIGPDLMSGGLQVVAFGRGLAKGAEHAKQAWQLLTAHAVLAENLDVGVLGGFLQGLETIDEDAVDALLDEVVTDATLGRWFVVLQTFPAIDSRAVKRLHRALEVGKAPLITFCNLALGQVCDGVPGPAFKRLVLAINAKPDGNLVALELVSMRIFSDESHKRETATEVIQVGRSLLSDYDFSAVRRGHHVQSADFRLATIVRKCLPGTIGKPIVRDLCRRLLVAASSYKISAFDYNDVLTGLLTLHPVVVLNELMVEDPKVQARRIAFIADAAQHHAHPLESVSDATLMAWCNRDPHPRYPFATAVAALFVRSNQGDVTGWRETARMLLRNAPNKAEALKGVISQLRPTGGGWSIASQYVSRLKLLDELDVSDIDELAEPLATAKAALTRETESWRQTETTWDREQSSRFE